MMQNPAGPVKGHAHTRDLPTTPHPIGPMPPLPPRRVVAVGRSRVVDGRRVRMVEVAPW
jgi:hypothetical protein